MTTGGLSLRLGAGNVSDLSVTSNGTYEGVTTSEGTQLLFRSNSSFDGSISNISVKEITDDTDLPRINYEGFSYQDSLGSEEIVNGDFDTDSGWTKGTGWSIQNGYAESTALNTRSIYQNIGNAVVGKKYKITYTILETNGGNFKLVYGGVNGTIRNSIGTYTEIITATSSSDANVYFDALNVMIGKIDNVSVKEYLGQEVVPDSGCGSWLLEPQSTNLVTESSDLTPWWSESGATIENTSIVSPDGTQNVKSVKTSSTGSYQGIFKAEASAFADKTLTLSAFAKKSNNDYIFFYNIGGVQGNQGVWFNISDGTIGTNSSGWTNTKIENYGNGWYRCSSTVTFAASGQDYIYIQNSNSDNNINSDINKETYIWGTQLEEQSYATSYIPTNGATNTRLQDIANNSGNSTLINSTEGVLYTEIAKLDVNASEGGVYLSKDSNNEIRLNFATNNRLNLFVNVGGVNQVYMDNSSFALSDYNKIAVKYKLNDYSVYVNGTEVYTDTSALVFSNLDELKFNNFYGKNKTLAVYKEALTDANLRCLTYPNPVATTFDLDFDTIAEQFTFTRGSEATFVNEQGLIESTNQIGPELVTNGDFATDSDWNKGSGWSISGGKANANTVGSFVNLRTNSSVVEPGKIYDVSFDVSNYTQGSVRLSFIQSVATSQVSANGTYTARLVASSAGSSQVYIQGINSFIGSIDNVSVKEVTTATNTPRIDYSTGEKAFLLEPQSTNLITYSEDFGSGSGWVKFASGISFDANTTETLSPQGLYNATKIISSVNNEQQAIYKSYSIATPTISCYAKAAEFDTFNLKTSGGVSCNFTLTGDGEIGYNTNTSAKSIEYLGNGWYRCSISSSTNSSYAWISIDGGSIQGDGTSGIYIWGAQLEQLSYPTSYIPTAGATATRNQELCNNATPVINSEEGTLYAEISPLADDGTFRMISISDGTNNNRVRINYTSTNLQIQSRVVVGGVTQAEINKFGFSNITDFAKIALSYKQNEVKFYINGELIGTDTSATMPSVNTLNFLNFNGGNGGNIFFGNTKGLKVYPKALADVQLEDLTTI